MSSDRIMEDKMSSLKLCKSKLLEEHKTTHSLSHSQAIELLKRMIDQMQTNPTCSGESLVS